MPKLFCYRELVGAALVAALAVEAGAQDLCDHCDLYLINGLYDTEEVEFARVTTGSLKEWFFTDEFEQLIKGSTRGLKVGIPLDGVLLGFEASDDTTSAWEKRRTIREASRWDFSKAVWYNAFFQHGSEDSRSKWLECIRICIDSQQTIIRLEAKPYDEEVILKLGYTWIEGLIGAPTITGITCTSGLDSSIANQKLVGKELLSGGQSVKLPWVSDNAHKATIVLNTDMGQSRPVEVTRPPQYGSKAIVEYWVKTQKWVTIGTKSKTFGTPNDHNKRPEAGYIVSPDGKWRAHKTTATLTADPGLRLANPKFNWAGGKAKTHWKLWQPLQLSGNGRTATAVVWTFTRAMTFRFEADLQKLERTTAKVRKEEYFRGRELKFSLPKGVELDARVTTVVGNDPVVFYPMDARTTPPGLIRQEPVDYGLEVQYTYILK